jgi:hypothetical protein
MNYGTDGRIQAILASPTYRLADNNTKFMESDINVWDLDLLLFVNTGEEARQRR